MNSKYSKNSKNIKRINSRSMSIGSRKTTQGISMIDVVIWLAVVGVIISTIYGLFGQSQATARSQAMMSELLALQSGVRNIYEGLQNGFEGLNAKEVIISHAYPTSLRVTGTGDDAKLYSTFAGEVTFAAANDKGNNDQFSISFERVPSAVCQQVINKIVNTGGFTFIVAGGKSWDLTDKAPAKKDIDEGCTGVTVKMIFTSR